MSDGNCTTVFVVSDSVGETAELVVRAAASQFDERYIKIQRIPYAIDQHTVSETIQAAKEVNGFIAFTLVTTEMQQYIITECEKAGVKYFDILTPLIDHFSEKLQMEPIRKPGLIHKLDEQYFKKIEAVEFAVKYDDGKDPRGLLHADVVLIGVSRTSKTPLSMYLAHKGLKVANVPLVPEVEPPEELFTVPKERCIGLVIDPSQLAQIRRGRLISLGLTDGATYANMSRILEELQYAEDVIEQIGGLKLNVTNRAVEETANVILEHLKKI